MMNKSDVRIIKLDLEKFDRLVQNKYGWRLIQSTYYEIFNLDDFVYLYYFGPSGMEITDKGVNLVFSENDEVLIISGPNREKVTFKKIFRERIEIVTKRKSFDIDEEEIENIYEECTTVLTIPEYHKELQNFISSVTIHELH